MQDDCVRQFANILAGYITLYVFGALVRFITTRRRVVHQGLVAETRAASMSVPLLDGNELRPVLHLHARHEPILAVLGLENRGFAFLHIEPVLALGIDDVGLVRDEEGVFALFWQPACGMISN